MRVNQRIHVTCLVLRREPTKRWHYFFPPLNGPGPLSAGFIIFCCLKVSGERWTGRDPQGSEDGAELGEPLPTWAPGSLVRPWAWSSALWEAPAVARCLSPASSPGLFLPRRSLAWSHPYLSSTLQRQGHLGPFFPIAIVILFYLLVTVSLIFLFFSKLSLSFLIFYSLLLFCSFLSSCGTTWFA